MEATIEARVTRDVGLTVLKILGTVTESPTEIPSLQAIFFSKSHLFNKTKKSFLEIEGMPDTQNVRNILTSTMVLLPGLESIV